VEFHKPRFIGQFSAGYGRAGERTDNNRNRFLLNANARFLLGRKVMFGVFANRRYQFSVLTDDGGVRLTTQGGVRFATPVGERFNLNGTVTIGKNDFGDSLVSGEPVRKDTFQRADVGLSIKLIERLSIRPGIFYFRRNSDIDDLQKEALGWSIAIGYGYVFDF
jgi:hypothetical protein